MLIECEVWVCGAGTVWKNGCGWCEQHIESRTIDTDLYEWFGDVVFYRESPSYAFRADASQTRSTSFLNTSESGRCRGQRRRHEKTERVRPVYYRLPCMQIGHRFIGIEKEKEYFEIAKNRISEHKKGE